MTQQYLRQAFLTAFAGAFALACAWSATGASARRHAARPADPMPAVRKFIAGFTRREPTEAVADISIVDEVPPLQWRGPGAFQAWTTALQQAAGGAGVTLHGSGRTDRDTAYVIAPVLYSYQTHGAVVVEPARMAISVRREGAGWRITGWAWAGTNPQSSQQATVTSVRFLPPG